MTILEELVSMGLLIKLNNGIQSGKNKSPLYVKVLPKSFDMQVVEQFITNNLQKVQIPWLLYKKSCTKLILSSSSAKLSEEADAILTSNQYTKYLHLINLFW